MKKTSIIYIPQVKKNARLRLLCFPHAGGNSSAYSKWVHNLHDDVELAMIQLPGRGSRFLEKPYEEMDTLVKDIFIALNQLDGKKNIFYGHSMGARVAYELTLMLQQHQCQLPMHIIASGSEAPFIKRNKPSSYGLPDREFIESIRELNGSPKEILENDELMQLLLPAIRADFKIIENYCNKNKETIPTKVSVFAGKDDDIDVESIEGWLTLFDSNTGIHWFDGGHFFINENNNEVLKAVNSVIGLMRQ